MVPRNTCVGNGIPEAATDNTDHGNASSEARNVCALLVLPHVLMGLRTNTIDIGIGIGIGIGSSSRSSSRYVGSTGGSGRRRNVLVCYQVHGGGATIPSIRFRVAPRNGSSITAAAATTDGTWPIKCHRDVSITKGRLKALRRRQQRQRQQANVPPVETLVFPKPTSSATQRPLAQSAATTAGAPSPSRGRAFGV